MRQASAAIAEWLERGRFANAPEGARPSGWPVAGLAAGRPLKAVVSLLWASREEAPVPAVVGWQHGHVGPVWLGEPMFVALGDLEKLFAFRASTKEVHDRKCSGCFFSVQQMRATYFSNQGFTGVDNYPASRIAPQFSLSHSGSGSSHKVVIGVYRFRTAIASTSGHASACAPQRFRALLSRGAVPPRTEAR